jgi:hypothetical protein
MSVKIAEEVGLRSSDAKPGALVETASVAADDAYRRDIPRQFVILQYATRNQAVNGSRVLYTVAGSPVLVVSKKNGRRVMAWDPAELIPDIQWVDKPFVDFIGSPCAYVMVARVLNDFLQGTNSPHVEEIDTARAVNVGYWKLRDGSYRMLAGNLEEGLRHDADFNRHVTVVFPSSWGAAADVGASRPSRVYASPDRDNETATLTARLFRGAYLRRMPARQTSEGRNTS